MLPSCPRALATALGPTRAGQRCPASATAARAQGVPLARVEVRRPQRRRAHDPLEVEELPGVPDGCVVLSEDPIRLVLPLRRLGLEAGRQLARQQPKDVVVLDHPEGVLPRPAVEGPVRPIHVAVGEVAEQVVPVVAPDRLPELTHPHWCGVVVTLLQHEAPLLVQLALHGPVALIEEGEERHHHGGAQNHGQEDEDGQPAAEAAVPHHRVLGLGPAEELLRAAELPSLALLLLLIQLAFVAVVAAVQAVVVQRVLLGQAVHEAVLPVAQELADGAPARRAAAAHLRPPPRLRGLLREHGVGVLLGVGILLALYLGLPRRRDPRPHPVEPQEFEEEGKDDRHFGVVHQRAVVAVDAERASLHLLEHAHQDVQDNESYKPDPPDDAAQGQQQNSFGRARGAEGDPADDHEDERQEDEERADVDEVPQVLVRHDLHAEERVVLELEVIVDLVDEPVLNVQDDGVLPHRPQVAGKAETLDDDEHVRAHL
mmetsp:Transcript_86244/g.279190  ORF Transcript_86244/g.279190 Transcript_86244/m.279190 type:complete len:486 (-) Transcript_86244:769-2226(-)